MEIAMDIFDNCQVGPDDPDSHYEDDPADEPVGSCDECGTNLYPEDDEELCDQCLWRLEGGQ